MNSLRTVVILNQPNAAASLDSVSLSHARVLVTGSNGMLATDLVDSLRDAGVTDLLLVDRDQLDICDASAVDKTVADVDVVINCAAYTAVDAAEEDEGTAFEINATGAGNLAEACARHGARLVHISTDYVFAGDASEPYSEDAEPNPAGAYGRTKAAGEQAVRASGADALVVRTAWLYGRGGPCFPKTIARLVSERGSISVVDDQIGQPTWTRDVSAFIVRLLEADAPAGIYHATSAGKCSWFDFATAIIASAGLSGAVEPTTSDKFPRPAPRPAWSVLGHDAHEALGIAGIGPWDERWQTASAEVLADIVS